jgi:rhodanese-related sulfurtransferase
MEPRDLPVAIVALVSCSGALHPTTQEKTLPAVVPVERDGIAPLSACRDVLLAGQPSEKALRALAADGLELVIDLRLPGEERGYDEPALLRELGVVYVNPGFGGPETLTDGTFDAVRDLLSTHEQDEVLVHCKAAVRVGAVWLAARVLDGGMTWESALEEARRVGMRGDAWEARAREYVQVRSELDWPQVRGEIRKRFPSVRHVSIGELATRLEREGKPPLLLDVRAPEEFAVSHLAGARSADTLGKALSVLGDAPKDGEIVVYCSVGYRSSALAEELSRKGYTGVRNLEGSIFAWANSGRPVVRGEARVERVHPYDRKWGRLLDRRLWSDPDGEDK